MTPLVLLALGLGAVDARVQAAVDKLAPSVEAIVVMEAATGRVLGRAGKIDEPLPPGSTFKLVTTLAAMHTKPTALDGTIRCDGHARYGEHTLVCFERAGHGDLDLVHALAESCNLYFGEVGVRVGTPAMLDEARALGVGAPPGKLPPPSLFAGEVADGSGVRVTALEQAELVRAIATGRTRDGKELVDRTSLARLHAGMRASVVSGTAQLASHGSVAVAGKTGTADFGASTVGWFIGFAPADAPTVIVVIVGRGVRGHDVAAHAPALLSAWFLGR